ncbi:hypothetical protein AAE478_000700 [Parahypoxylon ruwenzoriense]
MDQQQPPSQPLFGLVPAGQPLITSPTSQPNPTSFLYAIPSSPQPTTITIPSQSVPPRSFAHLAVFLLPGVTLPAGSAAAIYIAQNPAALASGREAPNFKFLGGIGAGKESAVFKLSPPPPPPAPAFAPAYGSNLNPNPGASDGVIIGIDIEDASSVASRMQQLQYEARAAAQQQQQPPTQVLAQRIIQNAFNFLSGFSGKVGAEGIEVVPLKAFQEWWRRFENKVRNDPGFLEREQD